MSSPLSFLLFSLCPTFLRSVLPFLLFCVHSFPLSFLASFLPCASLHPFVCVSHFHFYFSFPPYPFPCVKPPFLLPSLFHLILRPSLPSHSFPKNARSIHPSHHNRNAISQHFTIFKVSGKTLPCAPHACLAKDKHVPFSVTPIDQPFSWIPEWGSDRDSQCGFCRGWMAWREKQGTGRDRLADSWVLVSNWQGGVRKVVVVRWLTQYERKLVKHVDTLLSLIWFLCTYGNKTM